MTNLKMPIWWDSIRAILSLTLATAYCYGILFAKIPRAELEGLQKMAELAIVFYFVLKKRVDENDKPNP